MAAGYRASLIPPNRPDATFGKNNRPTNFVCGKVVNLKFTLIILFAFTGGVLLIPTVTDWWLPSPLSSSSWKQPGPAIYPPATYKRRFYQMLNSSNPENNAQPSCDEFCSSEPFRTFMKKKHENYSSVAEYLSSVKNYLLAFRSPMIREDPSIYSWPETNSEKTQRQTSSSTKLIVVFNPPSYVRAWTSGLFGGCPVNDCALSMNYPRDHTKADAVLFHGIPSNRALPRRDHASQVYIFLTMESPVHTRSIHGKGKWKEAFNWTWNFRTDSDIFEPVGYLKRDSSVPGHNTLLRLMRQKKEKKKKYVAWMSSNCGVQSMRDQYVGRLQKVIPVDHYGHCGNLTCRRNRPECNTLLNDYLFYLSLENSVCRDYITEKYYLTFREGVRVMPVVRGGGNYSAFFPAGTFIDADAFRGPEELGRYLLSLARDEAAYVDMLWRTAHFVYHEHGIHNAFCQVCYKLHHLDRFQRTYPDMDRWYQWRGCSPPKPF